MNKQELLKGYELMLLSRMLDEKMLSLQRQGRLGTFAPVRGHEAIQIGSILALHKEDWVVPYFRQWAAFLARGFPIEMLLQYNSGDERGMDIPLSTNMLPVNIPVASQVPHAVGLAWGFQKKKEKKVVLCFLGDGATSKGDFHEALNFSGVFKTPNIFVVENNQYAISVPLKKQTASSTLAQKALAYGIEGVRVDGTKLEDVYEAILLARKKALEGIPVLIEAVTYRLGNHTTADEASKYRSKEEVEAAMKKDPVPLLRKDLIERRIWNESKEKQLVKKLTAVLDMAVKKFESLPSMNPLNIFKYTYGEMTSALKKQASSLGN